MIIIKRCIMAERNTKQKESIIKALMNTTSHPTIYEIYEVVKEEYPTIGQATVYRNILNLVNNKQIKKFTTKDGIDHYDGNINPHIHMHCIKCKKVSDIFDKQLESYIASIAKSAKIEVTDYDLILQGTCNNCMK